MNLSIRRPATPADAEAIAMIGRQSFTDTFGVLFIHREDMIDYVDKTYSKQRVETSLQRSSNIYFLGLVDDQPAGFAKLKINSSHPVINKPRQCELQRIYVLKEFHGCGIAQNLMSAIIDEAKKTDAQSLWLDVHIHNERAKKFYNRNGFLNAGDHRFTIGSQEFLYYVMELDLHIKHLQSAPIQKTIAG